jgi:hypothetical protein
VFALKVEQIAQLQSFIESEKEYHSQAAEILARLVETLEEKYVWERS